MRAPNHQSSEIKYVSIVLSNQVNTANQTKRKIVHKIFLNLLSGSDTTESFLTNFCQSNAIANNITANQSVYAHKLINHEVYSQAIIIDRIIQYVGLQLVKTGQSEAQSKILQVIHSFWFALCSSLLDLSENHILVVTFFHKFGNIVIIQNSNIMIHEACLRMSVHIHERTVVACTIIVKIIIERDSEPIIIYGLYLFVDDHADAHSIIGSKGKTQGASIVSIPAKKDIINKAIDKIG